MRPAYRKKLASDLWGAHLLLTRGDADERVWAIDAAERLLRDLPPSFFPFLRDDALDGVEAARCGDAAALADSLDIVRMILERPKPVRPRNPRKPSVNKLIAQAGKSGKPVSSVTTPDGYRIAFGEPVAGERNEWDEVLPRHGAH
jgi:hypothetical protein